MAGAGAGARGPVLGAGVGGGGRGRVRPDEVASSFKHPVLPLDALHNLIHKLCLGSCSASRSRTGCLRSTRARGLRGARASDFRARRRSASEDWPCSFVQRCAFISGDLTSQTRPPARAHSRCTAAGDPSRCRYYQLVADVNANDSRHTQLLFCVAWRLILIQRGHSLPSYSVGPRLRLSKSNRHA